MDLEKYIRTMKEAYRKAYQTFEWVRMDRDIAFEKLSQEIGKSNMSPARAAVQREDLENKFNAEIEQIKADLQAVVEEQSAKYKADVYAYYAPDGSRIDLNDMNLINSGLRLSVNDIWNRLVKYADNLTMIQIFQKYVMENKIRLEGETGNKINSVFMHVSRNGRGELDALKGFIQLAGASDLGAASDAYYFILSRLDEYELRAQIKILEARPLIDENVRNEISKRDAEITRLEEARRMKKNPRLNWRQLL